MHRILVISLLLAGCATTPAPTPDPVPAQGTLDVVGKKEDKLESRTAAAVSVAKTNADQPAIVRAELTVAEAGLPKPSAEDLAYAQARAAKADPKAYAANVANANAARADINDMWAKLEA